MEKNELLVILQAFEKDFGKLNDALIDEILTYVNKGMTPENAIKKALDEDYFGMLLPLIVGSAVAAALLGAGIKVPTVKQRKEIEYIIKHNSWSFDGINLLSRFKTMEKTMKQVLKDSLLSSQRQLGKLKQDAQGLLDYFRKQQEEANRAIPIPEKTITKMSDMLPKQEIKAEEMSAHDTPIKISPAKENILLLPEAKRLPQNSGKPYAGIPTPKDLAHELPQYLRRLEQTARQLAAGEKELLKDYQLALRVAKREIEKFDQRHKEGKTPNRNLRGEYNEVIRVCEKLAVQTDKFTTEALDRAVEYAVKERMKYYASRVARSEGAATWFDGFIARYQDDSEVAAYRWRLHSRHNLVQYDQCDVCANMDVGLGKGIYPKNMVPSIPRHPHCMCMLAPVRSGNLDESAVFNPDHAKKYLDSLTDEQKTALFGHDGAEKYKKGVDWQSLLRGWDGFVDPKSRLEGLLSADKKAKSTTFEGKPQFIKEVDLRKAASELQSLEKEIVGQDYESAVVITQAGKMYKIDGTEGFVNINALGNKQLNGAYMTHNHPDAVTNGSFSSFDISEAMKNRFSLLRTIDKDYICEIKFTNDTIFEKADIINHKFTDTLRKKLLEDILLGKNSIDIDVDEYHALNEMLAKEYRYSYRRYPRSE